MSLFVLLACAVTEKPEDPAEHACEHVGESAGTLAAGATREEAAVLPMDGEPYTVTLVEGAAGFLAVEVAGDTAALLFAETADIVTGLYEGDEEAVLPEGAPNELCPEDLPEHFDLDLHEAGTWYVEVGPAAVPEVVLQLASAEGHGHEDAE